MNEVLKALRERRSIRSFKPDMPKPEELEQIVEAGLYAPSGMNRQDALILVVRDKALRDRIMESNRKIGGWPEGFDPFYGAPVIMIVLADKKEGNHVYDGTLVMANLMLAAHGLGLGGIWINRARQEFETEEYKQLLKDLGIEGEWEGIGHCAIGYIDGEIPAAAPRNEGRVYYL